jgi:hypothetical protein
MERIDKILGLIKTVIDLPTAILSFLVVLITLFLIFEEKIFAPDESPIPNSSPIYMEFDTTSGILNKVDQKEKALEIKVLKDNIPVRIIGYTISLAEESYVYLKYPVTNLKVTVRNEPLIAVNILLYDENRWLLDRYDTERGVVLKNLELKVNNTIIPKSTIKYYIAPDEKLCADYVFRLSDLK